MHVRVALGRVEAHDLTERMHAGVGAARPDRRDLATQDDPERVFEAALHGGEAVLSREAVERGPVVRDRQHGHSGRAHSTHPTATRTIAAASSAAQSAARMRASLSRVRPSVPW